MATIDETAIIEGPAPEENVELARGIAIDRQGFFVAAFQWPKGKKRPQLNPKGTAEKDKLTWLTSAEALADPKPEGKWDPDNLVWLLPDTPACEVLQRQDKPNFWTLQGQQLVWPEKLPDLPDGRKWVLKSPPENRAKRPVWSDADGEWVFPSCRMAVCSKGVCQGMQLVLEESDAELPTGGRLVDPDQITVTDEIGESRKLKIGDVLNQDNTVSEARPPRYKRVPVRIFRNVLKDTGNLAAFQEFLQEKGYSEEKFEAIKTVSLNNALLREFVVTQGSTLKQAYNALQKAAEAEFEAEQELERELGAEE